MRGVRHESTAEIVSSASHQRMYPISVGPPRTRMYPSGCQIPPFGITAGYIVHPPRRIPRKAYRGRSGHRSRPAIRLPAIIRNPARSATTGYHSLSHGPRFETTWISTRPTPLAAAIKRPANIPRKPRRDGTERRRPSAIEPRTTPTPSRNARSNSQWGVPACVVPECAEAVPASPTLRRSIPQRRMLCLKRSILSRRGPFPA